MSAIEKPKRYKDLNGNIISISDSFIYEVSKYRLYKGRAEYVSGMIVKRNSYIKDAEQFKYENPDYVEAISLNLIYAPESFIYNNKLDEVV